MEGVKGDGEIFAVPCAAFVQVIQSKTSEFLTGVASNGRVSAFSATKIHTLICKGIKIFQKSRHYLRIIGARSVA